MWRHAYETKVFDHRHEAVRRGPSPAAARDAALKRKLPDPVRRHLIDVIIDRTDADGLAANWNAQPVWSHDLSNNDKREFTRALFEILREYDPLTDD